MKTLKFISGVASGCLLLEIIIRIISPVIGPPQTSWQIQQQAKIIKIRERPADLGSIDLLIMGDSTGKDGVDPEILDENILDGFHSFNASLNSSTTYTIMKQFREILPYARPKYLLIVLGPGTSRSSDVDQSAQTYDEAARISAAVGIKGALNRNLYLYRYRNNLRDPFIVNTLFRSIRYQSLREGVVYRNVDTMKQNGDSIFPRTFAANATGEWEKPKKEPLLQISEYPKATMEHLLAIQRECKKKGIEMILSTVPTSNYSPTYVGLVSAIAKRLNIYFIEGNNATRDLSDFSDGVHLNALGAEKYSIFLGKQLSTRMGLSTN